MKGIDTLKFLLSLAVVWCHTGGDLFFRPSIVFFVITGFFLFGKLFHEQSLQRRNEIIGSWWKKTLRLYLLWSLIFLPYAIIGFANDHLSPVKAVALYCRNLFLVGENYLSWPLWFMLGLLWAGGILWLANKLRIPFWGLCLLAVLLYLTPRILHLGENELFVKLFKSSSRNGFFIGFPFMVLGGLIRRIIPPTEGWNPGCWQHSTALFFRFLSAHIYFSHMLFAGAAILIWGFERSLVFWAITCAVSIITGLLIRPCDGLVKFLYGRSYRN